MNKFEMPEMSVKKLLVMDVITTSGTGENETPPEEI